MALQNNIFGSGLNWQDKILQADLIWAQVKSLLAGVAFPATPRRPDVRMILKNVTGADIQFQNPGDHSGSKPELIPATGDKTAAMIMPAGATIEEQFENAKSLDQMYDLSNKGLSDAFVKALQSGKLSKLINEAYGPAPFEPQAEKIVDLVWKTANGASVSISPHKGLNAAFGARAATKENVFHAHFPIYVQGTGTTPELIESFGMCIAISSDWKTGQETTRPIVPSVAATYYGEHFKSIPAVTVTPDGIVRQIDLNNQTIITAPDASGPATPAP